MATEYQKALRRQIKKATEDINRVNKLERERQIELLEINADLRVFCRIHNDLEARLAKDIENPVLQAGEPG